MWQNAAKVGEAMRAVRWVVVLAVLMLVLVAERTGLLRQFSDPEGLRRTLLALGGWGYFSFVGSYALLQPFGIPGTVFVVAAALVWPWPVAFALSLAGTMAASVVGFSLARFVARDWVAARIPERLRKYDDAIARRAFATVFMLRLGLWMPPWLHAFFGVSQVRFGTHFWASLLGYLLPLFLVSLFGRELFDWVRHAPKEVWIALGLGLLCLGAATWWRRRRQTELGREG